MRKSIQASPTFSTYRRVTQILFSVLLAVGVLLMAIGGIIEGLQARLLSDAQPVEAQIAAVEHGKNSYVLVAYANNGAIEYAELNVYSSTMRVGNHLTVYVNSQNPGTAYLETHLPFIILLSVGGFLFLTGVIGLVLSGRGSRKQKWIKKGEPVWAQIIDVRTDAMIIDGIRPWRIHAVIRDPDKGRDYLFQSERLAFDPKPFLQQPNIRVYVRPGHYSPYYMDVSGITEAYGQQQKDHFPFYRP